MKRTLLFASLVVASGIMLTNIYTSIVDAPSWGSNIPSSINAAREYYKVSNPGNFFRIFSPLNQGLGLLCVVLFWKSGKPTRHYLLGAFLLYCLAEGLTFMYFYPRNAIMFESATADQAVLRDVWQQWSTTNWLRTLVVAAGVVCSAMALHRSYTAARQPELA
jgi:uncharacterized membrane protein